MHHALNYGVNLSLNIMTFADDGDGEGWSPPFPIHGQMSTQILEEERCLIFESSLELQESRQKSLNQ